MTAEREPVSSCCFVPIEDGQVIGLQGFYPARICLKCHRVTREAWDSLPPAGTFEAAPGKTMFKPTDGSSDGS